MRKKRRAIGPTGEAKSPRRGDCVDAAEGTYSPIALEDLFAQVCGLGAKLPLVHAERGAEGIAAAGNFEAAPAAEAAAIGPARHRLAIDPTSLHCPHGAHSFFVTCAEGHGVKNACGGYKDRHCGTNGSAGMLLRIRTARGPFAVDARGRRPVTEGDRARG